LNGAGAVSEQIDAGLALSTIHQTLNSQGSELFDTLVRKLSEKLGFRGVFITRISDQTIEVFNAWLDGKKLDKFECGLIGTPCEQVLARTKSLYFDNVCQYFPSAHYLAHVAPYCYMGTPIADCGGSSGTLVVMADSAIKDLVSVQQTLEIYAKIITGEFMQRSLLSKLEISPECAQKTFAQSLDLLFFHDIKGRLLDVNASALAVFGYDHEDVKRLDSRDLTPDDDETRRINSEALKAVLSWGVHRFETRCKNKKGQVFNCEVTASLLNVAGQEIIQSRVEDLSSFQREKDERLKLSRAAQASSSGIMITDINGQIEYVNPKFTELTGYSREEVMGKTPRIFSTGQAELGAYKTLWTTILSGDEWRGEFRNRKKNGDLYWCRNSISGIKDEHGQLSHYLAIQDDVSREYELKERLSYQASHDLLTGLCNRHEFERRTELLLAKLHTEKTEHAICFLDLDQFKVINDTCGHVAGDELLRQLGPLLQSVVRRRDTLARVGGDEFAVLMEYCSLDNAERLTKSLLEALQDYRFTWGESTFRIGASIGLAEITEEVCDLSTVLKNADAACYMAKDSGRNRVHVYRSNDWEIAQRQGEMEWVSRIYRAMSENQFCLYGQAIKNLDSNSGRFSHYELLLRIKDDNGVLITPGAFMPAAERYNLVVEIDRWVVTEAIQMIEGCPTFMQDLEFIFINLSGQTLSDESFLDFLLVRLKNTVFDGAKLCFEITETAAITNLNVAQKFIQALQKIGCKFALDDFGSGLSSFAYLKDLAVDFLKIDGMFIKEIANNEITHAMVKSINDIGHVMGIQTIAEFVENETVEKAVKELGINYAQGHGIEKPQPLRDILVKPITLGAKTIE
jgi:diguanylate cyclase (GGDEF)-like protein/PAS domain S-box-containing protein